MDAVRLLRRLEKAGVRRALICDTGLTPGRVVRKHLEHLGLLALLEVQIFSDEIGAPKPNARLFRAALEALETPPGEALHVGDSLRADIGGAAPLGIRTVWITRRIPNSERALREYEGPPPDHVIADLAEIDGLLSAL